MHPVIAPVTDITVYEVKCVLICLVIDRRRMNIFQEASNAPLREPGKINVTFTPRVFPTPTRESLAPEEEAVCMKDLSAITA